MLRTRNRTACTRFYDWCLGIEASDEYDALRVLEATVTASQHGTYDALREARSLVFGPAPVLRLDAYRRKRPDVVSIARCVPAEIIQMPRDRSTMRKDRRSVRRA